MRHRRPRPPFYLDPHPSYAWLRENRPIYWDDVHQLWVLAKHADISYVSIHPELFCSGQGIRPTQSVDLSIVGLDGERHAHQRRLLNKGFSPRMIRAMEPRVRQVVTEVLDGIAGKGECDFVNEVAIPVPLVVIAELMGLPLEDRVRLGHWSDRMMGGEGRPSRTTRCCSTRPPPSVSTSTTSRGWSRSAGTPTATAATSPADIITTLVGADEDGVLESNDELTRDELTMFLTVLLVAGNETTRNAISGGMWALSQFPAQWERLHTNPGSFATMADEICRYVSPSSASPARPPRTPRSGGCTSPKGRRSSCSTSRPTATPRCSRIPTPSTSTAPPTRTWPSGSGPHVCMGINLARLEIRVLFEELVRRFGDMTVAPGASPTYVEHALVHAIDSLPVVYSASPS